MKPNLQSKKVLTYRQSVGILIAWSLLYNFDNSQAQNNATLCFQAIPQFPHPLDFHFILSKWKKIDSLHKTKTTDWSEPKIRRMLTDWISTTWRYSTTVIFDQIDQFDQFKMYNN
jgi:hypothetical protein